MKEMPGEDYILPLPLYYYRFDLYQFELTYVSVVYVATQHIFLIKTF